MGDLKIPGLDKGSVEKTLEEIKIIQNLRMYRDSHQVFFVEGIRNFVQAADTKAEILKIIYSERLLTNPLARKLMREMRRHGTETCKVTPENFRYISTTKRASGIGAIIRQKWTKLHHVLPNQGLCWIVLEKIQSPGNFGTLIRSSEAIGGAGFIMIGQTVDPFDPTTVRATMGAHFHQIFIRTNPETLQHWIRRHSCQVIGAAPDGNSTLYQLKYKETTLLFLGEERKGLSDLQRKLCQKLVSIPMVGKADSLNVAVAGSLLMYEVYRSKALRLTIHQKSVEDSER